MTALPAVAMTYPSPLTVILSEFVDIGGGLPPVREAVTATGVVPIVTEHVVEVVAVQPDHSALPPAAGLATSITVVPGASPAVHVCPASQPMPPPLTKPEPVTVTESWTSGANVAVTDRAVSIWTVHVVCVPLQAPPQLVSV